MAVKLLEQVAARVAEVLPETHAGRLSSQHNLATAYWEHEQTGEAITLLEKVVTIKAKVLAETHPSRLSSEKRLARMLRETDRAMSDV